MADDAAVREWHSVWAAAQEARSNPGGPDPYEFVATMLRHRPVHEPVAAWTVRAADGGAVGVLDTRWWEGEDNRHRLDVEAAFLPGVVAPPDLLDPLRDFARSIGRTLLGLSDLEGAALDKLAVEAGAKLGQIEHRNVLFTAGVDRDLVRSWTAAPPGYSVVAFDDPCPEELIDAFATLRTAMNDAPRGGLALEDIVVTPERIRAGEQSRRDKAMDRWIVCARHDATGELAGFTELELSRWRPKLIEQGDTVVIRAHRGHGLGRVIKSVNLTRLLDERPDAEAIETWNAEDNEHMLSINYELGFRMFERGFDYDLPA